VNVIADTVSSPFITTWKTDNPGATADNQIQIKTSGGGYNYTVDWGDGQTDSNVAGDITHTYAIAGTYTVSITGDFPQIIFGTGTDAQKLLSIEQWGNIQWRSMQSAFSGCINLVGNASDVPDLSQVTDMSGMFLGAGAFNQNIGNWDVSSVTDMSNIFWIASTFNQNIDNWDVSSVTNMFGMFAGAVAFNQDLSNWNVSSVTNMEGMFFGASTFNQNLGSWDVSFVTMMNSMFTDVTLSQTNYDALLLGWSVRSLQSNVRFNAGNSQYSSSSQAARDTLTDAFGWTVTDGGLAPQ